MPLKEKLSHLSQALEEARSVEQQEIANTELAPIRAHIKELETQKHQLELVKGSLELHSGSGVGTGMKEYKGATEKLVSKNEKVIDSLLEEHTEALSTVGVTNRDELLQHEEFGAEPEAVEYKEALSQKDDLHSADEKLQKKLASLGVMTEEKGTYDTAVVDTTKRLEMIEAELLQEKLKTPEGREEIVSTLAENIADSTKIEVGKDEKEGYKLSLNYESINATEKAATFKGWSQAELLPKNFAELEAKYGKETVIAAIKRAHANKIEEGFEKYDKKSGNVIASLKKNLERSSPEVWAETVPVIKEFQNLTDVFTTVLEKKAAELETKGVHFNSKNIQSYGGNYKEFATLGRFSTDEALISKVMNNPQVYPPQIYFDELKTYTEKRNTYLKELIEDIEKLQSEEDVHEFVKGENCPVQRTHRNILSLDFDNIKVPAYEQVRMKELFTSYREAMESFEKTLKNEESTKEVIVHKVELGVDAQLKRKELSQALGKDEHGQTKTAYTYEREIEKREVQKGEALDFMSQLIKFASQFKDEQLVLKHGEITVPAIREEMKSLKAAREEKEKDLEILSRKITEHLSNKPTLFGKDKWKDNLDQLQDDKVNLGKEIEKMSRQDYNALAEKYNYQLPIRGYGVVSSVIKNIEAEGTIKQITEKIEVILKEIIDISPDPTVQTLYKEYKDLEKQLS
jgi:hypothetical protein